MTNKNSQRRYEIGMVGLGVMGRNLLLNMAEHGHSVAGYDKDAAKVAALRKEAKNLETIGNNLMPNTAFKSVRLRGVNGPAVTWVGPRRGACAAKNAPLAVMASSTRKVRSVHFAVDGRRIAVDPQCMALLTKKNSGDKSESHAPRWFYTGNGRCSTARRSSASPLCLFPASTLSCCR